MSETISAVEALALYHDLWDLKRRAERMNRTFLVYLLQVAMEDLQGEISAGNRASATLEHVSAE